VGFEETSAYVEEMRSGKNNVLVMLPSLIP